MRFSNNGAMVSCLHNSALKTTHPDPQNYAPAFWHDFHNKEQASGIIACVSAQGLDVAEDRPGGTEQNYRRPDTTKTIKVGRSRYDADKVAPKMTTVSALENTTKTRWDTTPSNPLT